MDTATHITLSLIPHLFPLFLDGHPNYPRSASPPYTLICAAPHVWLFIQIWLLEAIFSWVVLFALGWQTTSRIRDASWSTFMIAVMWHTAGILGVCWAEKTHQNICTQCELKISTNGHRVTKNFPELLKGSPILANSCWKLRLWTLGNITQVHFAPSSGMVKVMWSRKDVGRSQRLQRLSRRSGTLCLANYLGSWGWTYSSTHVLTSVSMKIIR